MVWGRDPQTEAAMAGGSLPPNMAQCYLGGVWGGRWGPAMGSRHSQTEWLRKGPRASVYFPNGPAARGEGVRTGLGDSLVSYRDVVLVNFCPLLTEPRVLETGVSVAFTLGRPQRRLGQRTPLEPSPPWCQENLEGGVRVRSSIPYARYAGPGGGPPPPLLLLLLFF